MSKWNSSETGILRKKNKPDKFEDLLVFGYACKLFRDDEKALYVDQGKHLISWMGNDSLKIDRYDCRGALSDLTSCEASREGYDATRWLGLSDAERKIEQLCDQERYYALHANEDEEAMYREEELKRLQQKTNEFQYSYDAQNDSESSQESVDKPATVEEDDRPYEPPPELDVPADITIPKTVKENARIVKTAQFISKQGPQMEILIKTKQADNPQFNFMNSSDPLYKFYRHVLQAIKNGTYKVPNPDNNEQNLDESAEGDYDGHYLHPTLQTPCTQAVSTAPSSTIPTLTYRPSADCSYSQLVNRIQGTQFVEQPKPEVQPPAQQMTYEQQQQYYQYYYAMQYYEYYKQLLQYQNQNYAEGEPIPAHIQEQLANFVQYMQQQQQQQQQQNCSNNPYAQLVSNLSQAKENFLAQVPQPPPEPEEPKIPVPNDITKAAVIYSKQKSTEATNSTPIIGPQLPPDLSKELPNAKEKDVNGIEHAKVIANATKKENKKEDVSKKVVGKDNVEKVKQQETEANKPLLSLVHYGTDSEEDSSSSEEEQVESKKPQPKPNVKVPPSDIQLVIDKMASYVAKNGTNFESIVRSKEDPRFEFLNASNEYHHYYRHKIEQYSEKEKKESPEKAKTTTTNAEKDKNGVAKQKEKKVIAPVCFSIKKPKESDAPKEIKSALPVEESDDEQEDTKTNTSTTNSSGKDVKSSSALLTPHSTTIYALSNTGGVIPTNTMPIIQATSVNKTHVPVTTTLPLSERIVMLSETKKISIKSEDKVEKSLEKAQNNGVLDNDDPILEMIDLTYDADEKKDARRAEDKIKDKLAAAAREKLASVARDKALQLERKKKAEAFLKLKSASSDSKIENEDVIEIKSVSRHSTRSPKPLRKSKERHRSKHRRSRSRSKKRSKSRNKNRERSDKSGGSRSKHKYRSSSRTREKSRSSRKHRSRSRSKQRSKSKSVPAERLVRYRSQDKTREKSFTKSKSRTPSVIRSSKAGERSSHSISRSMSKDTISRRPSKSSSVHRSTSRSMSRDTRSRSHSHVKSPVKQEKTKEHDLSIIKEERSVCRKASVSSLEEGERLSSSRSPSKEKRLKKKKKHRSRSPKEKSAEPVKKRKKDNVRGDEKVEKIDESVAEDILSLELSKTLDEYRDILLENQRLTGVESLEGKIEESGTEEGEIKKHKSGKKKKSHKRKRSRSSHSSKSKHHKKSKKRRRSRTDSRSSENSS